MTENLTLQGKDKEKDATISKLKEREESLQKQFQQNQELSNRQKEVIKAAKRKKDELESDLKTRDARIKEVEISWNQERSRGSQLQRDLGAAKIATESLSNRLVASENRVSELERFVVALHDGDMEKS